uniref:E3 ubiquitin-protein ligase CBL n=1 Tax=Schistocephalus solidus TaxID=70667 RepID=A0A0V0J6P1_SCHSO
MCSDSLPFASQSHLNMRSRFSGSVSHASTSIPSASSTSASRLVLLRADKKVIDEVYKRLEKLVRLCQHPRLQLRNSPPYLLEILPDMYEKLKGIITAYNSTLDELFNTLYFQVFLNNLINKCKSTSKLFKEAKELMYDEHSEYRRKLTKNSLVFSHILKDLEALYPNNRFSPETFRITKKEAADWWRSHFDYSPIIPWQLFQAALSESFHIDCRSELRALQSTIDLTCNDHVSVFEFDVFVRLFQPWNNVIETWKALAILHAGYMAFMTYDEVKAVLKRFRHHPGPGSYVYRLSCTKLGQWAIGYITQDRRILQTIIQNKSLAQALIDGEREGFYLYPNGTPSQSSILSSLVENLPQTHLRVSQEQYQLYCKMGSTFELCKICTENNKNVQLEPCGHLLCKSCLISCQGSGTGQTCPFCRLEIKSIEEIILDPYLPDEDAPESSHELSNDHSHGLDPPDDGLSQDGQPPSPKHSFATQPITRLQRSASQRTAAISYDDSCLTDAAVTSVTSPVTSIVTGAKATRGGSLDHLLRMSTSSSNVSSRIQPTGEFDVRQPQHSSPKAAVTPPPLPPHSRPPPQHAGTLDRVSPLTITHSVNDAFHCPPIRAVSALIDSGDNIDDLPSPPPIPLVPTETQTVINSGCSRECVKRLLLREDVKATNGPPMTEEVAQHLLEITNGNYDMAARIWSEFVPRSSSSLTK